VKQGCFRINIQSCTPVTVHHGSFVTRVVVAADVFTTYKYYAKACIKIDADLCDYRGKNPLWAGGDGANRRVLLALVILTVRSSSHNDVQIGITVCARSKLDAREGIQMVSPPGQWVGWWDGQVCKYWSTARANPPHALHRNQLVSPQSSQPLWQGLNHANSTPWTPSSSTSKCTKSHSGYCMR
jgi:hypothetical protein